MKQFQRAIVRRVIRYEERVSTNGKYYNWSRSEVHTITAECGHTREHRGMSPPTKFIVCKRCAKGFPPVAVEGPLGVIDACGEVKDPIAKAFIDQLMEGRSR